MADNNVTVKGTVASVVFRNDETGYTVLVLELVDGGKVTCVGSFANLSVGAVLSVSGHKVNHRQYGEQIVADNYTMCNPTSEEGIVRYLSSGLIKGVGVVTAQNIYDMFGDDTFGVIENNPMLLSRVRGISKKKAMEIANAVSELKSMQEQIMFLQGYGMTVNLAMKIYNNYGADTKRLVLANPYRLVDDIDGIGFRRQNRRQHGCRSAKRVSSARGNHLHSSRRGGKGRQHLSAVRRAYGKMFRVAVRRPYSIRATC